MKVFPAVRVEDPPRAGEDLAYAGELGEVVPPEFFQARMSGEQEFVIFAVAQGVGQTGPGPQGNGGSIDFQQTSCKLQQRHHRHHRRKWLQQTQFWPFG